MSKIREDEATMRELVQGVESCMRKVILADHSTAFILQQLARMTCADKLHLFQAHGNSMALSSD